MSIGDVNLYIKVKAPSVVQIQKETDARSIKCLRSAIEKGVPFAVGTDYCGMFIVAVFLTCLANQVDPPEDKNQFCLFVVLSLTDIECFLAH